MVNSIRSMAKFICSNLTFNDLSSLVPLLLEVLSGECQDFELKKEEKDYPNYQKFSVDPEAALIIEKKLEFDYKQLILEWETENQRPFKKISRRTETNLPPETSRCSHCDAPFEYLRMNGTKYVSCKVCNGSTALQPRTTNKITLHCPYCVRTLGKWKKREAETIFKCTNELCPCYIKNKAALTPSELALVKTGQAYRFKLHYQYRIYNYTSTQLQITAPDIYCPDFNKIHNNLHVVGLILSYAVSLGMSSRQTRIALKMIHGINVSHQTVLNYMNTASILTFRFLQEHINIDVANNTFAADETYIIVGGRWHYTWFVIEAKTKALVGFEVSDTRGTLPALKVINQAFPDLKKSHQDIATLVADGNPAYDCAIHAFNREFNDNKQHLIRKKVIGLQNKNEESKIYRRYKNLIERLNRTYKFHTRPRSGFKSLRGAWVLTILFVAFYDFMRPHNGLEGHCPIANTDILTRESWPAQWSKILQMAS